VGFHPVDNGRSVRPKVVCHYLLEKMRMAGVTKVYVILRKGKWDIPAYLGDGEMIGLNIGYLILSVPYGVPFTLEQAYPFVKDALIVFGFPDIIFQPEDAFLRLFTKQAQSNADIVLGLFTAREPHKMDMVELSREGQVRKIEIKPTQTNLKLTWIIAVWTPEFTKFMHRYVLERPFTSLKNNPVGKSENLDEVYLGDVIQAAIRSGMHIDNVLFDDGTYIDIGTPEDMVKAVKLNI
jgi:glucose-1-phosphate thymidylyltransferase